MNILDVFPSVTIPLEEKLFFNKSVGSISLSQSEHFVYANARCDKIGFIHSGRMQSVLSVDHKQVALVEHQENQFVTAFTSLLSGEPSRLAIRAMEPTHLTVISDATFHILLGRNNCWVYFWLNVFQNQVQQYAQIERAICQNQM